MLYIASSLLNAERVRSLRDRFASEHGIQLTYDWTTHGQVHGDAELIEISTKEALGVIKAKCVLVVLPARSGTHFEMGLAFGLRIPVVILADQLDYVSFQRRPEFIRHSDEDAAVETVVQIVRHGHTHHHLLDTHV